MKGRKVYPGLEANMTVTNVIEVVVALALLYPAYRFFQKWA